MSLKRRSGAVANAAIFAALGDETRLALLSKLATGQRYSIASLTQGTTLTRQAVTKHLHVLERARIVHGSRTGRESLYEFNPQPIDQSKAYLDRVSKQWDSALSRLKSFVEE
jgi:DNA-binding transcriptional ArsR family regulator